MKNQTRPRPGKGGVGVRHRVRRFTDAAAGLRELAPFIRDGRQIQSGRPIRNFGRMLPREAVANWLLCAVLNWDNGSNGFNLCTDPTGGDGLIADGDAGDSWATEHVMVPRLRDGDSADAEALILDKIASKNAGGASYAGGKVLIVLVNAGAGIWYPNRVAKALPEPMHFAQVWAVALQTAEPGGYTYAVSLLSVANGPAPTWLVSLNPNFSGWSVSRIA